MSVIVQERISFLNQPSLKHFEYILERVFYTAPFNFQSLNSSFLRYLILGTKILKFFKIFFYLLQFNMKHCINPLNAELNSICHLLALLGARHIFDVSSLRVKEV